MTTTLQDAPETTIDYMGTAIWRGFGKDVKEARSSEEAIRAAGMDFEVVKHPIETKIIHDGVAIDYRGIPNRWATVRSDTLRPLGIVGDSYRPLQNREAFGFMDSLLASKEIVYETTGCVKDGRLIWILARIPKTAEVMKGDTQVPYVLLVNGHDGKTGIRIMPTSVRLQCANALSMAWGSSAGRRLSFRHVGDLEHKVEQAREVIGMTLKTFTNQVDSYKTMLRRSINSGELESYLDRWLNVEANETVGRTEKQQAKVERVTEIFENEETCNLRGMRGTAYAALNAITYHVDHPDRAIVTTAQKERAFSRTMMNDKTKERAFQIASEMFINN